MEITVVDGDITQVAANALIAPVNSGSNWFGGIDSVIKNVAGNVFHNQLAKRLSFLTEPYHGKTVVVRAFDAHVASIHIGHLSRLAFRTVVFVIDDLEGPLRDIVCAGLCAAENTPGVHYVTMPLMRTGAMLGKVESGIIEVFNETVAGIRQFQQQGRPCVPTTLRRLTFVVYNEPSTAGALRKVLNVAGLLEY